jgi:alpha-1,3-mannosyltransferase
MSLLARAKDLAYNPDHTRWMTPLLLIADAALSGVIIEKIPCSCSPVLLINHHVS